MRLIDADALIAEWCDGCKYLSNGICDQDVCGGVLLMKEAPTIDPESLRGQAHWEIVNGKWVCDNCLCWLLIDFGTSDMNYCPNCGKKMAKDGD